jgi:hypothetical protein
MAQNHIDKKKDLFYKEDFPVPKGFGEDDVNLDAPPLFSDHYCLYYMHAMTTYGGQSYSLSFSISIRQDMIDFYYQCNIDTMDLFKQSLEILRSKNLIDKPPYYLTPNNVHFIQNLDYVTDVFGNRRKMNAIESGNIYFNLEKSLITKGRGK